MEEFVHRGAQLTLSAARYTSSYNIHAHAHTHVQLLPSTSWANASQWYNNIFIHSVTQTFSCIISIHVHVYVHLQLVCQCKIAVYCSTCMYSASLDYLNFIHRDDQCYSTETVPIIEVPTQLNRYMMLSL